MSSVTKELNFKFSPILINSNLALTRYMRLVQLLRNILTKFLSTPYHFQQVFFLDENEKFRTMLVFRLLLWLNLLP